MKTKIEKLADLSSKANAIMCRIQNIDDTIETYKKQRGDDQRDLINIEKTGYGYDPVCRIVNTEIRTKMTDYFLRIIRKERKELQVELEALTKKLK